MVDKLYDFVAAAVLAGMAVAVILAILRFLVDIGPLWAVVAILAGVFLKRCLTSAQQ